MAAHKYVCIFLLAEGDKDVAGGRRGVSEQLSMPPRTPEEMA